MQVEVEALPQGVEEKEVGGEVRRRVVAAFHELRQRLPLHERERIADSYLANANGRRIPLCALMDF